MAVSPESLPRPRLADHVAVSVGELLADPDIEGVPSISDLAERLRVSRVIVREGMELLVAAGVLERHGLRDWSVNRRGLAAWRRRHVADVEDHTSLADRAVGAITDMIFDGTLGEGDPLPPTRELAERFDVSVLTVREALANLAARGIVERRQGREPVVVAPRFDIVSSILKVRAHLDGITLEEFQTCRIPLELESASLAAAAADRRARRAGLEAALAGMRGAEDDTVFNDYDVAFHVALAELSGNRAVQIMLAALNDLVRQAVVVSSQQELAAGGGDWRRDTIAAHEAIAEAVIAGRPDAARRRMLEHFRHVGGEARLA